MDILKSLYYMVEDDLPLRPGIKRREDMEAVLFEVMRKTFMEEYEMLRYDEGTQSRMDLFRHSLSLGTRLGSLWESDGHRASRLPLQGSRPGLKGRD